MTALETLITWGDDMLKQHPNKILSFAEAIDKAQELLEMEQDQRKHAFMAGGKSAFNCAKGRDFITFEEYLKLDNEAEAN
jgi:hypothetical protein